MDLTSQYCPDRRNLEEKAWALASRLFLLNERLLTLIGMDHRAFLSAKAECVETTAEIAQLRNRLAKHRLLHGC